MESSGSSTHAATTLNKQKDSYKKWWQKKYLRVATQLYRDGNKAYVSVGRHESGRLRQSLCSRSDE